VSTKSTIKHHEDSPESGGGGFHLYRDCFDEDNAFVYLEVDGVPFEAASANLISGRFLVSITIRLPEAWARKLGLIES
jgi:hypothetical protein